MERLIIKRLKFNDREIVFNPDVNFIIGSNGMGKTVLFNLIQYALGLKLNTSRGENFLRVRDLSIECFFGNRSVTISRELPSNYVKFSGNLEAKVNIKSKEFYDIYNELLRPNFDVGDDSIAALQILRSSFVIDDTINIYQKYIDLVKKYLGINIEFLKKSQIEINIAKKDIQEQEASYELLKTYITKVESNLKKHQDFNEDTIKSFLDILRTEYISLYEINFNNSKLITDAIRAYENLKDVMENRFNSKINDLEEEFNSLKNYFGLQYHSSLLEVLSINNQINMSSSGEKKVLKLLQLLLFSTFRNSIVVNGRSILVVDSYLSDLNTNFRKDFYDLVLKKSNDEGFQYIEFTNPIEGIPPNKIVLHLDVKEVFNWLNVD